MKIEDVEEFAFNSADVSGTEYAGGECPLRILERSVVMVLHITQTGPMLRQPRRCYKASSHETLYLSSAHEGTEEYPFKSPLGFSNGDVRFRPSDVSGCGEECGYRTLSTTDDRVYEVSELEVRIVSIG